MEIKKRIMPVVNAIVMLIMIFLFALLAETTLFGFAEVLKDFNSESNGTNILISFIVLSLTLSLLCYSIPSIDVNSKENLNKMGNKFVVNGVLMFIGFISLRGIKLGEPELVGYKLFVTVIVGLFLVYVVISFISYLFLLLMKLTKFQERMSKTFDELKEWYVSHKVVVIICLIIYSLIVTYFAVFRN